MDRYTKVEDIRSKIEEWKNSSLVIGLVPTMGALHVGHKSLIDRARSECDRVVVSTFVNPIQFGPNEDYSAYPRQPEKDAELCANAGVDMIFAPTVEEMYPDINTIAYVVAPEKFKNKLCGLTRKNHFDGVTTVVSKLFNIVEPKKAYFGQKDAQQLIIIKKIVKDFNFPIEIKGCPIVRENSGLACSSRNAYLSEDERKKAISISHVLFEVKKMYNLGIYNKDEVFNKALNLLDPDVKLEYLEAYDVNTFDSESELTENTLVAIAAKVGGVRLIDNVFINEELI